LINNTLEKISENDAKAFFAELKREIKPSSLFTMWFKNTELSQDSEGRPALIVANTFARQWIQKKFSKQLSTIAQKIWESEIVFEIASKKRDEMAQSELITKDEFTAPTVMKKKIERFEENSFADFEAGVENQLAFYAAKNIYQEESYNCPFTIVGDHGTGKTHLASAIINGMVKSTVALMHAEEFANSYINAAITNGLDSFRNSLRSKKVFILEDLDFILDGKKTKTIEEIIQTIKILKREKRMIIITSTRPLSEYESISPKLVNILLSGLKVRLSGPSDQTREKIIKEYLKSNKVKLSAKCLTFVEGIKFKNHRELLGALKQLVAFSNLEKDNLSLKVVKEILTDHLSCTGFSSDSEGGLDLHSIGQAVAIRYGVSVQKMMSSSRERHISEARHMAMTISYDYHHTLNEIGLFYGGRLHQSVLYSVKKIQNKRTKDRDFDKLYNKISEEFIK